MKIKYKYYTNCYKLNSYNYHIKVLKNSIRSYAIQIAVGPIYMHIKLKGN